MKKKKKKFLSKSGTLFQLYERLEYLSIIIMCLFFFEDLYIYDVYIKLYLHGFLSIFQRDISWKSC